MIISENDFALGEINMKKSLIIGGVLLDIVVQLDRLPKKGEELHANSQEMKVGGCAYNVADILKNFQVPYTLFAPIGEGVYAGLIEGKLKENGHESPLYVQEGDNGHCLCLVEKDGKRALVSLSGVERIFKKEWFDKIDPSEYDSVYVSGYEIAGEGGEAIIEFLEEHKEMQVYYAPGPRITKIPLKKHERIFALHPIVHLSEKDALNFTMYQDYWEAAEYLYAMTQNTVLITLGEYGCFVYDGAEEIVPVEKVKVIDSTGDGDSNFGTVIAMRQMGRSMQEAVTIANKVAALRISKKEIAFDEIASGNIR